jgi:hypothetical protein
MNPFHEEQQRKSTAGLVSFALTIVLSLLGIYNWVEVRSLIVTMLAVLKVNPYAWQGIDNMTFLAAGVGWLSYVFYAQHYLKKQAIAGRVLRGAALLLACQLWLLAVSRGIPALFGAIGKGHITAMTLEAAAALLLSVYVWSLRRHRQAVGMHHNHEGRG